MRTDRLARSYLDRARERLRAAESSYGHGSYPDVIRFAQECVEMGLKSCLRAVGIEHPKSHDVGAFLTLTPDRFPEWFQVDAEEFARLSSELASLRSPSLYGIELVGTAPGEIFGRPDAEKALDSARRIYSSSARLVAELLEEV
jgi:HEPN domain-containing protein